VFVGRHERWIWIGVFAIVLFMRWPMLKGYYYKVANVPAPATAIEWRTDFDAALGEARREGSACWWTSAPTGARPASR